MSTKVVVALAMAVQAVLGVLILRRGDWTAYEVGDAIGRLAGPAFWLAMGLLVSLSVYRLFGRSQTAGNVVLFPVVLFASLAMIGSSLGDLRSVGQMSEADQAHNQAVSARLQATIQGHNRRLLDPRFADESDEAYRLRRDEIYRLNLEAMRAASREARGTLTRAVWAAATEEVRVITPLAHEFDDATLAAVDGSHRAFAGEIGFGVVKERIGVARERLLAWRRATNASADRMSDRVSEFGVDLSKRENAAFIESVRRGFLGGASGVIQRANARWLDAFEEQTDLMIARPDEWWVEEGRGVVIDEPLYSEVIALDDKMEIVAGAVIEAATGE
jgi:hypothetical protein